MEVDLNSMMTDPALANNPWPVYAALREHAPAVSAPFSRSQSGTVVILSRYDDIHRALRSPELFAANYGDAHPANFMGQKRPVIPLNTDPPKHAKYRKLLDPLFSPRAMQGLDASSRRTARELLDQIADAGQADLHAAFTEPFPCRVFLDLVGFPVDDLDKFLRWKDCLIHAEIVAGTDDPDVLARLWSDTADAVYDYFDALLDRRVAEPADDLATRLGQARIDDVPLTRYEMIDILYLQMAAGLDTVTASLDCLVARLAGDIDLQRQARASADDRRQLIEELLRVDTPVQMVQRYAAKDMEMHGIHIAAGDMVMLLIGAANTDESAFTDAMRVDPTRDNTRHMAFGGGIHRCLGSHLARLELTVAFDEIFAAFGEFRLADGRQADFMPGIRTAKSLPLQWQTRTARATTAR